MAVLRVPGGELYYEVESDGVAVVLVHGLALDARMWDDQAPALKDIATVVRYATGPLIPPLASGRD